jgi:hypothetical protein
MKILKKILLWCILLHILPLVTIVISMIGGYSFLEGYLIGMLLNLFIVLTIGLCWLIIYLLQKLNII